MDATTENADTLPSQRLSPEQIETLVVSILRVTAHETGKGISEDDIVKATNDFIAWGDMLHVQLALWRLILSGKIIARVVDGKLSSCYPAEAKLSVGTSEEEISAPKAEAAPLDDRPAEPPSASPERDRVLDTIIRRNGAGNYSDGSAIEKAVALRESGMSLRTIVKETGLSKETVHKYVPRIPRREAMLNHHRKLKSEGRPVVPPWRR